MPVRFATSAKLSPFSSRWLRSLARITRLALTGLRRRATPRRFAPEFAGGDAFRPVWQGG